MRFAENTDVPVERSRAEIERNLTRYGADQFFYGWDENGSVFVQFRAHKRMIRFVLSLPDKNETRFLQTPARNRTRSADQALAAWEQECRRSWRALALVIKAKLEAVATEITSFEAEFLAHIVLPDNTTVHQQVGPLIEEAYSKGRIPSFTQRLGLPAPKEK